MSESDLDRQIEKLKRGECLTEPEFKRLCYKAMEVLSEESNVQRVDSPVTIIESENSQESYESGVPSVSSKKTEISKSESESNPSNDVSSDLETSSALFMELQESEFSKWDLNPGDSNKSALYALQSVPQEDFKATEIEIIESENSQESYESGVPSVSSKKTEISKSESESNPSNDVSSDLETSSALFMELQESEFSKWDLNPGDSNKSALYALQSVPQEDFKATEIEIIESENSQESYESGVPSVSSKKTEISKSESESNPSNDVSSDLETSSALFMELQESEFSKWDLNPGDSNKSALYALQSVPQEDFKATEIERSHYREFFQEISFLGEGGYGVVFKCEHKLDKKFYAVKRVGYNKDDLESTLREAVIHSMMNHHNVVRYNNIWSEEGFVEAFEEYSDFEASNKQENEHKPTHTLYIQMEICDRTIRDLIEKDQKSFLSKRIVIYEYMKQIFEGLEYIHAQGYIHGDITNQNIFLDKMGVVKIGDFGKGKEYRGEPLLVSDDDLGVVQYRAPETYQPQILISPQIDIYSAGLIFFELAVEWKINSERAQTFLSIQQGNYDVGIQNSLPGSFWAFDPAERPLASAAVEFFKVLIENEVA